MVGGAEGAVMDQGVGGGGQTQHGVDLCGLQGLLAGHVGEDTGQAAGQHGFSRTGRAGHEQVVAARGGNLQRALDIFLALNLSEVGQDGLGMFRNPGGSGRNRIFSGEVAHQLRNIPHGVDRGAIGQGGLCRVPLRDEQGGNSRPFGTQRHGEHPGGGTELAAEGQLAQKGAVGVFDPKLLAGAEDANKNGQVVQRADFFQMSGGQIDGDPADRKGKTAVFDGGAHPILGFADRSVGQTHHREVGQSAGQVTFGGDFVSGHAVQAQRTHKRYHK